MKSLPALLMFIFALAGCSQDPASVGNNLYPRNQKFTVQSATLASISDTTFKVASPNGSGTNVLVGKYSTVEAKALLQFLTTIPDTLAGVKIDTAELDLTVSYTWNMISTPAQFVIRRVRTPWSEATVTIDSLTQGKVTVENNDVGTINDTISLGKSMTVPIDTSVIRDWMTIAADTSSATAKFYSLALVTKAGQGNVGVWGFYQFGTSSAPVLRIIYEKNGVRDSIRLTSGEDTFVATRAPDPASGFIETQAGISVRSAIRFNLRPVSDSVTKAIVNNATMEITMNNVAKSLGTGMPDSLLALLNTSDAFPDSTLLSYYAYGQRKDTSQTINSIYVFAVTPMVQYWINTPSANHGVVLHAVNDAASVDKMAFYRSNTANPPKLYVTYTKK